MFVIKSKETNEIHTVYSVDELEDKSIWFLVYCKRLEEWKWVEAAKYQPIN